MRSRMKEDQVILENAQAVLLHKAGDGGVAVNRAALLAWAKRELGVGLPPPEARVAWQGECQTESGGSKTLHRAVVNGDKLQFEVFSGYDQMNQPRWSSSSMTHLALIQVVRSLLKVDPC